MTARNSSRCALYRQAATATPDPVNAMKILQPSTNLTTVDSHRRHINSKHGVGNRSRAKRFYRNERPPWPRCCAVPATADDRLLSPAASPRKAEALQARVVRWLILQPRLESAEPPSIDNYPTESPCAGPRALLCSTLSTRYRRMPCNGRNAQVDSNSTRNLGRKLATR